MSFVDIQRACEAAVAERAFPGFAWAVGTSDFVETGWGGRFRYEAEPEQNGAVDDRTLFDLASLTKVVATTSVAMVAVEQGRLALGDFGFLILDFGTNNWPVLQDPRSTSHESRTSISGFGTKKGPVLHDPRSTTHETRPSILDFGTVKGSVPHDPRSTTHETREPGVTGKETITIADLLLHQSGLPPYLRCEGAGLLPHELRAAIHAIPLGAQPRAKVDYSCLGFIILQSILGQVLDQDLNASFIELVRNRIGMEEATFVPSEQERSRIAPTETDADWRDPYRRMPRATYLQGEVHDPLAFMLGGISSNAGLFAGIDDIAKFAQELLQVHHGKAGSFVSPETLRSWTERRSVTGNRALGWDTNAEPPEGDLLAPTAFMHTGYTGTSIWISPDQNAFGVLLTNRVYPDDSNLAIKEFRLEFRNLALQAIG